MANNSVSCNLSDPIVHFKRGVSIAAYDILPPIYFVMGICSRCVCLVTFCKHYRKDKAFGYQILSSVSEILKVLTVTLCLVTLNNLSGFRLPGPEWFQTSYPLMWYSVRLAAPLDQAFITVSLLTSLCMTLDRVFAMAKPFLYKTIDHRRHLAIAAFCCFFFGVSTGMVDIYRYDLEETHNGFRIIVNEKYISSTTAVIFAHIRLTLRVVGNIALVFSNIVMLLLYRHNANKTKVMDKNAQRASKRKTTEWTLVILTLCQSVFTTIELTLWNTYFGMVFESPDFTSCFGKVLAPIAHSTMQIRDLVEFFSLCAISKQFRKMLADCVKCKTVTNVTDLRSRTRV